MRGEHAAYRVTVVCWGNICRSPMGEFMLREAFDEADLGDRVVVDSAGTSTDELGRPMDRRTTATLRRHGVTDTGFAAKRARQFQADSFDDSDLVLAADHVHDEILRRRARDEDDVAKVRLLRSFDPVAAAAEPSAWRTLGTAMTTTSTSPMGRSRRRCRASSPTSGANSTLWENEGHGIPR